MKPEHEQFLISHMQKMGFIFIIDQLKVEFPALTHEEACAIYEEFKVKHANTAAAKKSEAQLKEVGHAVAEQLEGVLKKKFGK